MAVSIEERTAKWVPRILVPFLAAVLAVAWVYWPSAFAVLVSALLASAVARIVRLEELTKDLE